MSAGPTPVLAGLAQAADALERNQLAEAAELLGNLAQLCSPDGSGPRLAGQELARAKELFARCQAAAAQRQAELAASLSQSVASRKASDAYQPNKR